MIQVDPITYDVESTDIATRVNFVTVEAGDVVVRLGDENDGFVAGDFVEIMNDGFATIIFEPKGFTTTITVDQEAGPVPTLLPKQRAVAYYLGPDEYQWDIHTSQGVNQSTAFMFQVGVPAGGHIHAAFMSVQQAKDLIHGTKNQIAVADPLQPSIVIRSYPNAENGDPLHYHELTVFFDYINHKFIVTNISNNTLDNHEAFQIGDVMPSPDILGHVLTSNGPWVPPTWQAPVGGGGGGQEMNIYVLDTAVGTFGGALINNWGSVVRKDENLSPKWIWDPYDGSFACNTSGIYNIIVEGQVVGDTGDPAYSWPDELSAYGVDLQANAPAENITPKTKLHTRYSPPGAHANLSGNFGLSAGASSSEAGLAATTSSFTERFVVVSSDGGKVFPKMFAMSYNSSLATAGCSMVISFMKVSDFTEE